jgi:hypothetical protein
MLRSAYSVKQGNPAVAMRGQVHVSYLAEGVAFYISKDSLDIDTCMMHIHWRGNLL